MGDQVQHEQRVDDVRRTRQPAARPPQRAVVQRRLAVGASGDAAEREADLVAASVLRIVDGAGRMAGTTRIRRAVTAAAEVGRDGGEVGAAVESRIRRAQTGGSPLDEATRDKVEGAFGVGFGDVRIHRNSAIAPRLGALAFTHGQHIHFATGRFDPRSRDGLHLLSHELTHVVQQTGTLRRRHTSSGEPEARPDRALAECASPVAPHIQRNIGVEIELVDSGITGGMALADIADLESGVKCNWEKRDIIHEDGMWDLTLDDTPGDTPRDFDGDPWKEGELGPYQMFHLEFVIHGGGAKKGFPDGDHQGLLEAIRGIEAFITAKSTQDAQDIERVGRNCRLVVLYPTQVPESANIQLTSGASLAGLQPLLAANQRSGGERDDGKNLLSELVFYKSDRQRMVKSYVSPEQVRQAAGETVALAERELAALSSMFSLIKTFLDDCDREGNPKEAALVLWKTPLTLFFESRDLGPCRDRLVPAWPEIIKRVFADYKGRTVKYPPDQPPLDIMDWLIELPKVDRLTEADKKYNKSFGGIPVLEGGAKTREEAASGKGSHGHPIFEFRSMVSTLANFRDWLQSTVDALDVVNQNR